MVFDASENSLFARAESKAKSKKMAVEKIGKFMV